MSKTFKKLLASALAATMLFSTAVTSIVVSATETVGTITAETVDIEVGATTFDADITIDFPDTVVAPHNIITVAADGYTLDAVALKDVIYATGSAEGKVTIGDEDGADGTNLTVGKILIEAPVDSKAPTVSQIVITATFVEDAAANAAGTYAITVNGDDMTNVKEEDIAITATNGVVNVHGASTDGDFDETNHWNVCVIENCDAHKYNEVAHVLGDYVANEDGTTETASCDCGYSVTRAIEVAECEHANKTFVSATPAVKDGEKGSIVFACDDCGNEIENTVTFLNTSALTSSPDISCDSTTQLVLKSNSTLHANVTKGIVVYTHHFGNGLDDATATFDLTDKYLSSGYYKWSVPVKYTQFTDTYDCVLYTERDGAWVCGAVRQYSIKAAAMAVVTTASNPEGLKKAAANLLVAGAAAQSTFKYAADNLADAELLGDYAQYVTTTVSTPEKIVGTNYNQTPSDYATAGKAIFATPDVLLDDSVAIRHKINFNFYSGNVDDLTDLKIVYSYKSYNGVEANYTTSDFTWNSQGRAEFVIGVTAPNMRVPITFQVFNGDTAISEPAVYSIEGVMAQALSSSAAYANVISAVLNYSDAVAAYF